jgi:flagellar biosynthesis protein FlhB
MRPTCRLSLQSLPQATAQVGESVNGLLWKAASLFVVFGSVDLFRQQRRYSSELRMTKQEVREENRRAEGDPQMKGRIRRLRRDMLRKQMMSEVPKATAVVVNPTHFAVAIRYDMDTMPCPLVVAKGKNWLALRIRQIAVESQVPIIENPPLARALYDAVEVGRAISPEFYKAIAEILAYVYRIMGRRLAA